MTHPLPAFDGARVTYLFQDAGNGVGTEHPDEIVALDEASNRFAMLHPRSAQLSDDRSTPDIR